LDKHVLKTKAKGKQQIQGQGLAGKAPKNTLLNSLAYSSSNVNIVSFHHTETLVRNLH